MHTEAVRFPTFCHRLYGKVENMNRVGVGVVVGLGLGLGLGLMLEFGLQVRVAAPHRSLETCFFFL